MSALRGRTLTPLAAARAYAYPRRQKRSRQYAPGAALPYSFGPYAMRTSRVSCGAALRSWRAAAVRIAYLLASFSG